MVTIFLISIILAMVHLAIALWGFKVSKNSYDGEIRMWFGGIFTAIYAVAAITTLIMCFRWQIGTDTRTGYIYSVDEKFGKGTVHIRLGENAGADAQEPFCVSGENLEKARALAGTSKKVKVTIPASGFHFENDYFACTSEPIIELYEGGEE